MFKLRFLGATLTGWALPLAAWAPLSAWAQDAAPTAAPAVEAAPAAPAVAAPVAEGAGQAQVGAAVDGSTVTPAADVKVETAESADPTTNVDPNNTVPGLIEVFSDGYSFNAPARGPFVKDDRFAPRPRINGIKNGSLAPTGHGLQMSWHKTGLLVSGNTWIDTGYRSAHNNPLKDDTRFVQQGRVMLRFTPMYTYGNWFVKGQAEILGHAKFADQNPYVDTDDAWLAVGYRNLFDVQFGRYEAWEVYHKGLGLERDTLEDVGAEGGQDIYEVNNVFYREASFGQVALHVYPLNILRLEATSLLGYQSADSSVGVRGTAILDLDYFKLKVAGERKHTEPSQKDPLNKRRADAYGFGGGIIGILPPFLEAGANAAIGYSDVYTMVDKLDKVATATTFSYGGFLNFRVDKLLPAIQGLVVGGGINITHRKNQSCSDDLQAFDDEGYAVGRAQPNGPAMPITEHRCGSNHHRQVFGAVQYDLFDHALLKVVVGAADAYRLSGDEDDGEAFGAQYNQVWNARLRFLVWY